ncbi:MAG: RNA polymerase sigma factor [Candidatus Pacebacteria bacterium]|nr:RNA polymerase sigma factor [Candidatus Paceibacterota bacterium]
MEDTLQQKFLESYNKYNDDIFRFCLVKVRNRDNALDITQDTFTKTWEYLKSGKEIDNIRAFLYQVARNAIIDWSRKKKNESLDALLESGLEFDSEQGEAAAMHNTLDIKRAVALIHDLPDKYRDIIYFRYVEDLSLQEISNITGERENTVSVRVHRGIKLLEDLFNKKPL